MKWIFRRLSPLLLTLAVLFASAMPTVGAAAVVLDPQEKTTFFLEYTDACAVEGEVLLSDSTIISEVKYDITGSGMRGLAENGIIFLYSDSAEGVDGKIEITLTVHPDAPKGTSCNVVLRYAVTQAGSSKPGDQKTVTHTVAVREEVASPPSSTTTTTTVPASPAVDTTALRAQIGIAQGLTYYDYTKDTWQEVEKALKIAHDCLGSDAQEDVDSATENLKSALGSLKKMNYTALQKALDSVGDIDKHDDLTGVWSRFVEALKNARIQRTSGDQAAVDKATAELLASKAELQKALEEMGELITVETQVTVPVLPTEPFCNQDKHLVRLILLIVSLVINAVLIALILIYLTKRNRVERDMTPLVEYDIDDDAPEFLDDMT